MIAKLVKSSLSELTILWFTVDVSNELMGLQTNKIIDIPLNIPHYSIIYMAKQSRAPTAGGLPGKGKISARIASGGAWLVASSREKML